LCGAGESSEQLIVYLIFTIVGKPSKLGLKEGEIYVEDLANHGAVKPMTGVQDGEVGACRTGHTSLSIRQQAEEAAQ
jgi:hypothetical protein